MNQEAMSSKSPRVLEDVTELMQQIQLRLPVKEAARTSVLSKSWRHAWSTIPTLRFCIRGIRKLMNLVYHMDQTLRRYLRDNIPIERFDLHMDIDNKESASLTEQCLWTMATNTCSTTLKELSLSFYLYSVFCNLPHEILSCENLTKMRVFSAWSCSRSSLSLTSHGHGPVAIGCVSLQELYLNRVNISQELLDGILSSCRLLTKIELINSSEGLKSIKVKNLPCLCQLKIVTRTKLEINHVPNLRVFTWGRDPGVLFNAHSISLGSNLKHLTLSDVVTDNASLDMIKSGASSLESLTIDMVNWKSESFDFTCASIKRLLLLSCQPRLIKVKVYAPSLLFFGFDGETMPSLFFPLSTLINQTTFWLDLQVPSIGVSFFLKMRKALGLSSNCDIQITAMNYGPRPLINVNIHDLRTRLPFPRAVNVKSLSFKTRYDECMWERSPFFDAFFEICHPNHVTAMPDRAFAPKNHFCKVMMTEVLEKKTTTARWPRYLKHVQILRHTKWETLTNANKSFLEGHVQFKLEWH